MSGIPERLWRVLKGHWALVSERAEQALAREDARQELDRGRAASELTDQINAARARREARGSLERDDLLAVEEKIRRLQAQADAYAELSAHLDRARLPRATSPAAGLPPLVPRVSSPAAGHDPLAVCYELLGVLPGADLPALESAYQARLAELAEDRLPVGSPQRELIENRRRALTTAYNRLRDVLNPTETRFEKLEF